MQLCFVSVHGPRETYFVDEPRITEIMNLLIFKYYDSDVYFSDAYWPQFIYRILY
jgi:hypothetical protein